MGSKGRSHEKKTAVLLDFVQIASSPPIWTTCTTFSDAKVQDLKVSLRLKRLYIHYNIPNLKTF